MRSEGSDIVAEEKSASVMSETSNMADEKKQNRSVERRTESEAGVARSETVTVTDEEYSAARRPILPLISADEQLNHGNLDTLSICVSDNERQNSGFMFSENASEHSEYTSSVDNRSLVDLEDDKSTERFQRYLGTWYLLDNLQSNTQNLDGAVQNVRDIFALSTKTFDQMSRTGAFHHMKKVTSTNDTNDNGFKKGNFDNGFKIPAADFKSGPTAKQNSTNKTWNSECKASDISRRLVTSKYAEMQSCIRSRKTLNLLTKLGFIVNLESSLIPAQSMTYIGALFNFKREIMSSTSERLTKLDISIKNLITGHNTARNYLALLGLIVLCEAYPVTFTTLLEIILCQIPFTVHLKSHLICWLDRANTARGRSLHQWSANITITTDASIQVLGVT
ncbi:unnamed protein product [Mytilus coruscus]|uniref:Uncharacterized protein n=1 Tax=Mytilus coruscus TaxID=42192 RepID=A0A6J8BE30_MYTCO|nr:unnamed protein product [Mytilus coruscus]